MSNAPVKLSHPFNVSSVFEVSETLAPADNRNYTFRGVTVSITCDGWDGDNSAEYDGTLLAYCGPMEVLQDDTCYALRAKMIPDVDSANFKLYYEADHKIKVGQSDTFAGELNNNTSASGLGIVSTKHEIPEPNSDDVTLAFIMSHGHADYSPELRDTVDFEVEYRIRPTQKMKKSQGLIQAGKETLVHGFIVDWDSQANRWIVEVTGFNVASGHQSPTKKKTAVGTKVTPSGRVRPAKHNPSSSPLKDTSTADKPALGKGKTRISPRNDNSIEDSTDPATAVGDPSEPEPKAGPSNPRTGASTRPAKKVRVA